MASGTEPHIANTTKDLIDLGVCGIKNPVQVTVQVTVQQVCDEVRNRLDIAHCANVLRTLFMGIVRLEKQPVNPLPRVDHAVIEEAVFGNGHFGKTHFFKMDIHEKLALAEQAVGGPDMAFVKFDMILWSPEPRHECEPYGFLIISMDTFHFSEDEERLNFPPNRRFYIRCRETTSERMLRHRREDAERADWALSHQYPD